MMLERLFLQVLNMSFTAGVVIVLVLAARLALKKAPKVFSYALWSVVLFRLVCPFSFESILSLLPTKINPIAQDIVYARIPQIDTGVVAINQAVNAALPPATPAASVNPLQIWMFVASWIWLLGTAALLLYSLVTLVRLIRHLRHATPYKDRLFLSDRIDTAFVLGVFRPKIYLPANLSADERAHILLHEETHIRRLDHVVKLLSFIVLCVHWFNPLVWLAFFASGKDMEMSCDEAVIRRLGGDVKKTYATSLLTLATGRRIVGGTPLAFGEGDTKGRIKNVLHYKKPALWAAVAAIIAVIGLVVGLISNPKTDHPQAGDAGSSGVNAVILAIDPQNQSMTVQGIDANSVIGDRSIITWVGDPFITVGTDGEPKPLSLADFAVGDYATLSIGPVRESYPTQATAKTIQLRPRKYAYPAEDLWRARTPYVGDNSAVSRLIGLLPVPYGLRYDHFKLHTSELPYSVEIVYSAPTELLEQYDDEGAPILDPFRRNALLLLALIDNADGVRAVLTDGSREVGFINGREWADYTVGQDVRSYAQNPESLRELIDFSTSETVAVEYAIMKLGKNGEVLSGPVLQNQQLAQAVLMDVLVKSAAWEGVDISALEESYLIRQTFPDTREVHDYYAYLSEDGTAALQSGTSGWRSVLSRDLYDLLVDSFDPAENVSFWVKPDESPQVIGATAAKIWLESFKGAEVSAKSRISAYAINIADMKVIAGEPKAGVKWEDMAYQYVVQFTYDITTATAQYRSPGDGVSGMGTFQNLFRELCIKVKLQDGGGYQIVGVGTGGALQEFA